MNIGIDIVDCERCGGIVSNKIFAPSELAYINQKNNALTTIAGLYAAKEAYCKAKGTGIVKSQLPQIVIAHDALGKPYYANDPQSTLSISHTALTAVAVCLIF